QVSNESGLYNLERKIQADGPEKKLNVFLITVESLSAGYLSRFGKEKDITPFLDQWLPQGVLFTDFYATGTRTTRGLEAITLSLPPTPGRSLVKRPEPTTLLSLGEIFQERGYDVAFIYGGHGFFDNMNSFFAGHGYRCVDQADFSAQETTFTNAWGVCDEDLYKKALSEADRDFRENRPFFFHLMTTSNHKPYTYPEGKIDIPSGENRAGAVKYTDYALNELITQAKTRPWFSETVFVVVADHCAHSAGKTGLPVDKYHIPLFLYAPKYLQPEENGKLASQIDIAPTLLGLLDFSYASNFFGQDIRRPDFQPRALIANYIKLGLLKNEKLVLLAPQQKIELQEKPYDQTITGSVDTPLVQDCLAYYQGADYIISQKTRHP
ncbi:MAG: LTA synthase family protein, partial [Deltaproteobacteria bacterium]|nr:LTA synthase family protein [Deltaproteobacteria bacterium]